MALTTHPFHPTTKELLASHRDAYLRGDLSAKNTELVDIYLKANAAKGDEAFDRFYALKGKGHDVRPVGWLQHQFDLVRTEPARFRRRAGSIFVVGALLTSAVFASSTSGARTDLAGIAPAIEKAAVLGDVAEAAAASKMTTINGQILDENGRPLVGATILDKARGRGVSTDAQGKYHLLVPANQASKLQFGYGGYSEEEVQVQGQGVHNVTLLPRTDQVKKRHWWQF